MSIWGGKHPVRLSFMRMISFRVLPIFPMLSGTHPPRLLFARTRTEIGEFPRFSGMPNRKLLSFKKITSRGLPKSWEGTKPSNSLKRKSRYLREGKESTTLENLPTNRLLLRSSSWSSFILRKLLGTTPQNLLELIWRITKSVIRPSSVGR
ncbi:hypothetical protein NC651_039287 [Populus alba x Populus x berolinensis]|nr:hypothetical protein NC651_039287 [Populus alba x Populus x berolinensis]